jgi:polysaccharide export outer membrane protein
MRHRVGVTAQEIALEESNEVNTTATENARRPLARLARVLGAAALLVGFAAQTGCEVDSYMDQSVVGRWEYTPTVVPILERIDVIEGDQGEFVETTPVMPDDLVPQVADYRVGAGDALYIEIFDFLQPGVATPFERIIDARGELDLPQLGSIPVLDLTASQIRQRIRERLREGGIIEDALVSVQVVERRQATYSIFGQVAGVGRYVIPEPNYRLLEAITEAGGISPGTRHIFVIRQAPLVDAAGGGTGAQPPDQPTPDEGVDLDRLIEELQGEGDGSPGLRDTGFAAFQDQTAPPVDLLDENAPAQADQDAQQGSWVFIDGRWVRVGRSDAAGLPEGADPLAASDGSDLVTQRVIKVPVRPLIEGDARYNIVIRPGDVVRVPGADQGFVYLAGVGIARPGVYALPSVGRLTLTKAVMSAGGLTGLAVPKRVDLVRMIGDDRQATIRLNLKAIAEGTHPDVFLKSDDMVNVGTNFWAQPVAVIRNGFRATYGFGFLLDRNFGNDVFGPPPNDRGF